MQTNCNINVHTSFEMLVLNVKKKKITFENTSGYCRPPGHHKDCIKEFADFLSELVLAVDKVLIVGDFNIHVDYEKDDWD